jgi:hypothetical protein
MTVFALYSPILCDGCQSTLHYKLCSDGRKVMKNLGLTIFVRQSHYVRPVPKTFG